MLSFAASKITSLGDRNRQRQPRPGQIQHTTKGPAQLVWGWCGRRHILVLCGLANIQPYFHGGWSWVSPHSRAPAPSVWQQRVSEFPHAARRLTCGGPRHVAGASRATPQAPAILLVSPFCITERKLSPVRPSFASGT